jgi:hypothetical protein
MRSAWIVVPVIFTVGCGTSTGPSAMDAQQTYSLCPRTEGANNALYEQMRKFAGQQQARFVDRGDGVHRELFSMNSEVLSNSRVPILLLTVEKPHEFRVTVTNLGLKEKVALAVRLMGNRREDDAVRRLLGGLRRYWKIEEVDGSVTNDPPC